MSAFGDFSAHLADFNSLKTRDVPLAAGLQSNIWNLRRFDVILYALVAAVLLLVAVAFISSIDFSNTRRH
jgi:hypothetical protein